MEEHKIKRINELAGEAKVRQLTEEELIERDALRKEYIEGYRNNLKQMLGNIEIVDK